LDQNTWEFMGFGAMLYRDFLQLDTVVFGSILEAYLGSFEKGAKQPDLLFPYPGFGLTRKRYVGGLTEVATAFVCEYFAPGLVDDSLKSLADVGSTKLYRKELLVRLAGRKFGRETGNLHVPTKPLVFGQYAADDFLAFYIRKNFGPEVVKQLCGDMPSDAVELCDRLSLVFYERVMTERVSLCNPSEEAAYLAKLAEVGIIPWSDNDWAEFEQVIDVLRRYHPEIGVIIRNVA